MGASVAAIETVYRERLDELCSVAAAIVGERDAARDVVHDAFATALRARRSFRNDGPLEAWLWRTVVNAARDHRRRRRPELSAAEARDTLSQAREDRPELHDALARLPERQRLALFLRYYADLDYVTIATVLDVSTGTVGATLHAAHAALRLRLEEVPS